MLSLSLYPQGMNQKLFININVYMEWGKNHQTVCLSAARQMSDGVPTYILPESLIKPKWQWRRHGGGRRAGRWRWRGRRWAGAWKEAARRAGGGRRSVDWSLRVLFRGRKIKAQTTHATRVEYLQGNMDTWLHLMSTHKWKRNVPWVSKTLWPGARITWLRDSHYCGPHTTPRGDYSEIYVWTERSLLMLT